MKKKDSGGLSSIEISLEQRVEVDTAGLSEEDSILYCARLLGPGLEQSEEGTFSSARVDLLLALAGYVVRHVKSGQRFVQQPAQGFVQQHAPSSGPASLPSKRLAALVMREAVECRDAIQKRGYLIPGARTILEILAQVENAICSDLGLEAGSGLPGKSFLWIASNVGGELNSSCKTAVEALVAFLGDMISSGEKACLSKGAKVASPEVFSSSEEKTEEARLLACERWLEGAYRVDGIALLSLEELVGFEKSVESEVGVEGREGETFLCFLLRNRKQLKIALGEHNREPDILERGMEKRRIARDLLSSNVVPSSSDEETDSEVDNTSSKNPQEAPTVEKIVSSRSDDRSSNNQAIFNVFLNKCRQKGYSLAAFSRALSAEFGTTDSTEAKTLFDRHVAKSKKVSTLSQGGIDFRTADRSKSSFGGATVEEANVPSFSERLQKRPSSALLLRQFTPRDVLNSIRDLSPLSDLHHDLLWTDVTDICLLDLIVIAVLG